jgi:hypothetical protein
MNELDIKPVAVETKEHDSGVDPQTDRKWTLIIIIAIVALFAITMGGFSYYNQLTSAAVVTVDDLHQQNLEEELGDNKGYLYNGYSFINADGLWWTEVESNNRLIKTALHFGPKDVEHIIVSGNLEPEFNQGETVYITIDPNVVDKYYSLSVSELSFNVAQGIGRIPEGSCTKEGYGCENRTIISCEDPQGKPVIEFALEEEAKVTLHDSCIKVQGSGYEIVKSVDRLLYRWYKVMN